MEKAIILSAYFFSLVGMILARRWKNENTDAGAGVAIFGIFIGAILASELFGK